MTDCELCDEPITDEQVEDGEVYIDQVRLGDGSIDDEFYMHVSCWESHRERREQAAADFDLASLRREERDALDAMEDGP